MSTITMYGIANCDTIKKAKNWFEKRQIPYVFHDYKKSGMDKDLLEMWVLEMGWEPLLNKRGTTFRKLDDADKADLDRDKAIALMLQHPSMIKRPVIEHDGGVLVGFSEEAWTSALQ